MRLLICNFEITHKSEKINSINASLRQFNYKNENISANHLLLTLQRKLTRIESLNSFIFIVIRELYCIWVINDVEKMFVHNVSERRYSAKHVESRLQDETHWWTWMINDVKKTFVHSVSERRYSTKHVKSRLQDEIYCTWVINEVEKMSVHNVSENTSTCSAMHVRSMLLKIMILAVWETHLNEVHFLKSRISQLKSTTSKSTDIETLTHKDCNVTEKQLNFVAETVDCKQLISRAIVRVLTIHETTYNFSSKFVVELIKILQQEDEFAVRLKADKTTSIWKSDVKAWTLNNQEMIEYNKSLYVSKDLSVREELLKHHHDDLLAKHFNADKISELLDHKYYWKSMIKNIKEYINTCDICQRVKMKHHLSYDELKSLFQLTDFWKKITMNFITDLSSSKWKEVMYDLILMIVDHYMKMMHYLFMKKTLTVVKLAELFFKKIALRYEISNDIIIDKDSLFINAFWSEVCFHTKMKWWLSFIFHLQTDDQTEWQNQTLKHYLRVYCFEKQDDWATLLLVVEFMYHQTKHASLSCSLFKIMYDYKSIFDIHIKNDAMKEEVSAAKERIKMLQNVWNMLTQWWQNAIDAQAKYYNWKHKFKFFNVDDLVMLSAKNLKQKKSSKKLSNKMLKLFHIQEFIDKQMYHLSLSIIYRIHSVFHVFLLELYNCRLNDDFIFKHLAFKLIDDE